MPVVTFLFMNSVVIISSFLITYKLFRISNFIDSLITWFVLYFAQVVCTELILGILGALYLRNIVLLNLSVLLIIYLISEKNQTSFFNLKGFKDKVFASLENKIILFATRVILCFGLVKIFINLMNPPFGWDSLNYHFTFPVEWLKHANLDTPITVSDDPSPSYYPINGSLFYLWLMIPLNSVFFADLGQAPFFILCFLAIYSISRKIGIKQNLSLYSASLFFIMPNFFKQLSVAYVDVMVAGLFLACINSLFLLNQSFSWQNVLLYSLSLGLLLGVKTTALPYSALLLIPFVYFLIKNIKKFYLSIFLIVAILAFGSFSYARNFLSTGNPLYPLDFGLLGRSIFKGAMDINTYRAHFTIADYRLSKMLFHEGLGAQSLIFVLPSIFLTLPIAIIKKIKPLNFNLAYFFILPISIFLVYRYLIPLANVRYLYPLLGIGIILGFYVTGMLNIPKIIINIGVILCVLTSMFELAKRQELVTSLIITALLILISPYLIKIIKLKGIIVRPLSITAFFIISLSILLLLERWYIKNEYPRYAKMVRYSGFWPDATQAWDWLNTNTQGNNIAYVGRPVPFPLYGTNFKNNVYYVSVNKIEPAKLHYFPESCYHWGYDFLGQHKNLEAKGNYRGDANYEVWLNNLNRRNTDYLFIYSLHQTEEIIFPLEDTWAKANLGKFIPVFTNKNINIYKILK